MQLVNFETAKELSVLGFDGTYHHSFVEFGERHWCFENGDPKLYMGEGMIYPAPTLAEAADWLRTRYGINVYVEACCEGASLEKGFIYNIDIYDDHLGWRCDVLSCLRGVRYDDALQEGIKSALIEIDAYEMRRLRDC